MSIFSNAVFHFKRSHFIFIIVHHNNRLMIEKIYRSLSLTNTQTLNSGISVVTSQRADLQHCVLRSSVVKCKELLRWGEFNKLCTSWDMMELFECALLFSGRDAHWLHRPAEPHGNTGQRAVLQQCPEAAEGHQP